MSQMNNDVLKDFLQEALRLVDDCEGILDEVEGHSAKAKKLEEYANKIDRIMGGAKSLLVIHPDRKELQTIGHLAEACKALGYRGALTAHWPDLFMTTVAFLQDSNSMISETLIRMENGQEAIAPEIYQSLVDRLAWISDMYNKVPGMDEALKRPPLNQDDVDELIKKIKADS